MNIVAKVVVVLICKHHKVYNTIQTVKESTHRNLPFRNIPHNLRRNPEVYSLIDHSFRMLFRIITVPDPELPEGSLQDTVGHIGETGLEQVDSSF